MNKLSELEKEYNQLAEGLSKEWSQEKAKRLAELAKIIKEGADSSDFLENPKAIIMEIRAGAGGEEAALFARNLTEMYKKYAEQKGWPFVLISQSKTDLGGFKEVVLEIKSREAYQKLKQESGVHRIQRIPATEKTGRIHTSTASVAILPEWPAEGLEIKPEDLEISFTRSGGPGGQNVNKVETAVRILHKPSGLAVQSQSERTQARNREKAIAILKSKLMEEKRVAEEAKAAQERKEQIGSQDRAEKIRTYNFLQDRITDHRLKKSWHNIESILSGNLDPIINAFEKAET